MLTKNLKLVKNKKHNIDVIIDRLILEKKYKDRLAAAVDLALKLGKGLIKVEIDNHTEYLFND